MPRRSDSRRTTINDKLRASDVQRFVGAQIERCIRHDATMNKASARSRRGIVASCRASTLQPFSSIWKNRSISLRARYQSINSAAASKLTASRLLSSRHSIGFTPAAAAISCAMTQVASMGFCFPAFNLTRDERSCCRTSRASPALTLGKSVSPPRNAAVPLNPRDVRDGVLPGCPQISSGRKDSVR